MEYRIRDRCGRAHDPQFTEALHAERIHDRVPLLDENHVDIWYVSVDGHVILGQIVVHEASTLLIDDAFFLQGRTDSTDDATNDLTACCLGVQDATSGDRADDARDPDRSKVIVDPHFHKHCRMRMSCIPALRQYVRHHERVCLDALNLRLSHRPRNGYGSGRIAGEPYGAVGKDDVIHIGISERRALRFSHD